MSTDGTDTLTDNDNTPRTQVPLAIGYVLSRNSWIQDDSNHLTTDLDKAKTFPKTELRKIADNYPPNDVLIFEAKDGKFSIQNRALVMLHTSLNRMTGTVGTPDQLTQRQSNR